MPIAVLIGVKFMKNLILATLLWSNYSLAEEIIRRSTEYAECEQIESCYNKASAICGFGFAVSEIRQNDFKISDLNDMMPVEEKINDNDFENKFEITYKCKIDSDEELSSNFPSSLSELQTTLKSNADVKKKEEEKQAEIEKSKKIQNEKLEADRKAKGIDLYQMACMSNSQIDYLMAQIKREKEVGKIGGFVNKNALHGFASRIVTFKELKTSAEKEHKKRFKKALDYKKCKCEGGGMGINCK